MESEKTYNNRRNGKNDIIITETIYLKSYSNTSKHQQKFTMSSCVKKILERDLDPPLLIFGGRGSNSESSSQ